MGPIEEHLFLSLEWMARIVAIIEGDPKIRSKTSEFNLRIVYIVENLPQKLKELYDGDSVSIFAELDQGDISFTVEKEVPSEETVDFTVTTDYEIAKKNFQGELDILATFVKRLIKIRPWYKISLNPVFTVKALSTVITILKATRDLPTNYL
jgi:hypothetical protein